MAYQALLAGIQALHNATSQSMLTTWDGIIASQVDTTVDPALVAFAATIEDPVERLLAKLAVSTLLADNYTVSQAMADTFGQSLDELSVKFPIFRDRCNSQKSLIILDKVSSKARPPPQQEPASSQTAEYAARCFALGSEVQSPDRYSDPSYGKSLGMRQLMWSLAKREVADNITLKALMDDEP